MAKPTDKKQTAREWYYDLPHGEVFKLRDKIISLLSPDNYTGGKNRWHAILNERTKVRALEAGAINQVAGKVLSYPQVDPKSRPKREKKLITNSQLDLLEV